MIGASLAASDLPFDLEERVVPPELAGARLDRALAALVPGVSRTRLVELIADGGVLVRGQPAERPSQRVEPGWTIELRARPRSRERAGGPAEAQLEVVYEDEHLALVRKPPGVVVHPSDLVRGGTISELATRRYGKLPSPQGEDRPGIVHRLDAGTSGILAIARTELAARHLLTEFRERRVEKVYLALVHGEPRFESEWIDAPLGRLPGRPDRVRVVPAQDDDGEQPEDSAGGGREAETFTETIERFRGYALIRCLPRTGRTHQIRAHLQHIGHPIVGDRVYNRPLGVFGGGRFPPLPPDAPPMTRPALHALELAFRHPATGETKRFRAEPPADFADLLSWMRDCRAGS